MSATRKDEQGRRENPPQTVLRSHRAPEIEAQFWAILLAGAGAEWPAIAAPPERAH